MRVFSSFYRPTAQVVLLAAVVALLPLQVFAQAYPNKPGAGSNIAVRAVIDSPADGYTLFMAANALAANMSLYQPAPFDAEKDLVPASLIGRVPVVLAVNAATGPATLAKLLEQAKAKPGSFNYATPGNGSTPHRAVELFERAAGVSLQHIAYRGGAPAITDVIGGQVPMVAVNALEVLPHVKSGRLRVLAVLSATRAATLPDVPTIAESGYPGFEASVWYGLVTPAATPKAVVPNCMYKYKKHCKHLKYASVWRRWVARYCLLAPNNLAS